MKNRKNPGLGIVLMVIGSVMLLGMIGVHLGGMIPFAIGLGLLYWGYKKYQEKGGLTVGSVILFILGGMMTLSSVGALIPFFIASILLYFGYKYYKDEDGEYHEDVEVAPVTGRSRSLDEEFETIMKKS